MNKDELINEIQANKIKMKKLNESMEDATKNEEKLMRILTNGVSFHTHDIIKIIGYLLTMYENKLYIPVYGYYYDFGNQYDYMYLVPVDDFIALENKENYFKYGWKSRYNNQLVIVSEKNTHFQDIKTDKHRITFSHLLDEYGTRDIDERVCIEKFDDYPYIQEFISMVASMQIENNGKHLDRDELWMAMSDFINLQKDKPKTKELNKNN